MGVVPILVGLDLTTIANSTVIITKICSGIVVISAMRLPKKLDELWSRSRFHVSKGVLNTICGISLVITVLSIALLLISTSVTQIIGNLVMLAVAVVLMLLRQKHVTLNPSYTEN